MKRLIKNILFYFFGKELVGVFLRWKMYAKRYRSGYFSINNIDKKLEKLLPHKNGFYVEIGANDGALSSNSYFFELKKNWKGVLIEPAPNLFLSCLKRRGINNHIFCNACVPFNYEKEFIKMEYYDSMSFSPELIEFDSLQIKLNRNGEKFLIEGEKPFVFGAKAETLNKLLIKASAPKIIDFLSLDVEGSELEVLKGIDFELFKFKYMVIENKDIFEIKKYLDSKGYELLEKITFLDYLFAYRENLDP
tara:strand:- start:62 stop:808 length:747 start_codon:yes stop_codon:yes gene_type:complete